MFTMPTHRSPHAVGVAALLALPPPWRSRFRRGTRGRRPASLDPAPNPAANPTCGWAGSQVICRSDLRFTVTDADRASSAPAASCSESSERSHRHAALLQRATCY